MISNNFCSGVMSKPVFKPSLQWQGREQGRVKEQGKREDVPFLLELKSDKRGSDRMCEVKGYRTEIKINTAERLVTLSVCRKNKNINGLSPSKCLTS